MALPRFIILLLFSFLPAAGYAQPAEPIGFVLMTRGQVEAEDTNGTIRPLNRRSEIFVGDTLITDEAGFAQVRMVDAAQIALKEDTRFVIREYFVDNDPATPDRAILELQAGGFRTIDGLIGDEAGDEYRLVTPDADIVPFGTTYECVLENDRTLCGVYDGSITVSNSAGSLVLGLGGNYDYMEAADRRSAPVGLIRSPASLGRTGMNPVATSTGTSGLTRIKPA